MDDRILHNFGSLSLWCNLLCDFWLWRAATMGTTSWVNKTCIRISINISFFTLKYLSYYNFRIRNVGEEIELTDEENNQSKHKYSA